MVISKDLITTCVATTGGQDAVPYEGEQWTFTVTGTPVTESKFTVNLTDKTTGLQYQIGAGDITGVNAGFCISYDDQIRLLAGTKVHQCAPGDATVWNDPNAAGVGYVDTATRMPIPSPLVSAAHYQGMLVFFSRWMGIVYTVSADVANWSVKQVIANMGVRAPFSTQSLGELDVLFLSDTGIRSLRAKDSSLMAFVDDIGSPVDVGIQTILNKNPLIDPLSIRSIVEPTTQQYWLYMDSVMYVLSRYLSTSTNAWCLFDTFVAEDAGSFVPTHFVAYNGMVFARSSNFLYLYGGTTGVLYDSSLVAISTPWIDIGSPATKKRFTGVQVDCSGYWTVQMGFDPQMPGSLSTVLNHSGHTFDLGIIPVQMIGTHVMVSMLTTDGSRALFNAIILHYELQEDL